MAGIKHLACPPKIASFSGNLNAEALLKPGPPLVLYQLFQLKQSIFRKSEIETVIFKVHLYVSSFVRKSDANTGFLKQSIQTHCGGPVVICPWLYMYCGLVYSI